jgi:hypothetical protein
VSATLFGGIGDWILERGSLDGENGMDTVGGPGAR